MTTNDETETNETINTEAEEIVATPEVATNPPEGKIIADMTKEELIQALGEMMQVNDKMKSICEDYKERAGRIQVIWNDKRELKKRYLYLRDNTIPKPGSKINLN